MFSKPELLGDPAVVAPARAFSTEKFSENVLANVLENGAEGGIINTTSISRTIKSSEDSSSCKYSGVPVSMLVCAVNTLCSPPFLRRGVGAELRRLGGRENGEFTPRLQLAVVSVLRALLSGEGAKYVVRALEAAAASGVDGEDAVGCEEESEGKRESDEGELKE